MSYAQIDMEFTKYSNTPDTEYLLNTVINPATTFPTPVDACLVVQKGDSSSDEELIEVADVGQLITTPLPPLPSAVTTFTSPSLPSAKIGTPLVATAIQVDDVIRITTTPDIWQQFFSVSATNVDYIVTEIVSPTQVKVANFPAFARNLPFEVYRSGTKILPVGSPLVPPTDGVANRDYTATPTKDYYLAASHADSWADLTVAETRIINLKADAESLINAMNTADWTGTERAEYP